MLKALISKCIDMFYVRKLTADLLLAVNKRERAMKHIRKLGGEELREAVISVFELNGTVRKKVETWIESEVVPFEQFIFAGDIYLDRL